MTHYLIGIDPGVEGAIAIINPHFRFSIPIPMYNDEIEIDEIKGIRYAPFHTLGQYQDNKLLNAVAYTEKVWRPSKLVRIAGILEGIMIALEIPIHRVAPSTWRKEILGDKNATKDDAIKYCVENFGDVSLLRTERSRVPDHNLAEALCIAEYGYRKENLER